jgi:hypothetical protein
MVCVGLLAALSCGGEPGSPGEWDPETLTVTLSATDCVPILLDGLFSPGEWDDAVALKTGPHSTMLFKQDADYFYIGVDSRTLIAPSTDLFLAADSAEIRQFHVSAQVSERKVTRESTRSENPEWNWGYSDGWMANEVRWNDREFKRLMEDAGEWRADLFAQVAYPSHGAEFQFRKSRFGAQRYSFRLELVYAPDFDANPEVFPEGTEMGDITGWAVLELSRRQP